jgi:hypothetical protein
MTYTRSTVSNELFRASGLTLNSSTDTVTAGTLNTLTGSTAGTIDFSRISSGLLVVNAGNAPTGTNPGLAVFVDVKDAFGNWCLVSNSTAISGAVLTSSGTVYGNISASYQLTDVGRIRWVVTGTGSPSFTGVSFSLYGR